MANIIDNLHATVAPASTDDGAGHSAVTVNGSPAVFGVGSEWFNVTTGLMYKCVDATANGAVWVRVSLPDFATAVGQWIMSPGISVVSDGTMQAGLLTLMPITIRQRITVDEICVYLTTAGSTGAKCRLGFYAGDATTGRAGKLILDAYEVALDSTTGPRYGNPFSQIINPGHIWVGSLYNSVTTMPICKRIGTSEYGRIPNATLSDFLGSPTRYLSLAQTYGALPADLTGATFTEDNGSAAPIVAIRRAA